MLDGKIVLVTGATRGIGKAIALTMGKAGATVIGTATSEAGANNVSQMLDDEKISGKGIVLDVTDNNQISKLDETIKKDFGSVDILINNAGITGPTAPLWEYDLEMWKKVVEINLMGTFHCCKAIVPNMIKNNYGRIVNVASVAGKDGNANASAYSVGKAGAIGFTKSLGKELADKNIAVNAVTPAGAKTRILDQMTKEHVQRMLSIVPRCRFLEVEEFTSLICWLSSEENSFSTAAVFDISGGRSTY